MECYKCLIVDILPSGPSISNGLYNFVGVLPKIARVCGVLNPGVAGDSYKTCWRWIGLRRL